MYEVFGVLRSENREQPERPLSDFMARNLNSILDQVVLGILLLDIHQSMIFILIVLQSMVQQIQHTGWHLSSELF